MDTKGSSVCRCCQATDLGKESKGRKVCRQVLRDKDGSIGEMLLSKEQGTAKKVVKKTAKRREETGAIGCRKGEGGQCFMESRQNVKCPFGGHGDIKKGKLSGAGRQLCRRESWQRHSPDVSGQWLPA